KGIDGHDDDRWNGYDARRWQEGCVVQDDEQRRRYAGRSLYRKRKEEEYLTLGSGDDSLE
ncbi:hypothetical protein A2U01_0091142, partial [Trifolium medium]|nr:hypothetical protein [Trifolium medium]